MPAVRPTAALVLPHFTPEVMHSAVNVIAERLDDGIEDYDEESRLLNTDFRNEEVSRIIAEAEENGDDFGDGREHMRIRSFLDALIYYGVMHHEKMYPIIAGVVATSGALMELYQNW